MRIVSQILMLFYTLLLCLNSAFANSTDVTGVKSAPTLGDSIVRQNSSPISLKGFRTDQSFSFSSITAEFPVPVSILNGRNEAVRVFDEIDRNHSWISTISRNDIVTLPVGVKHFVNEMEYSIGIAKAVIHKDYSELTVFARVRLPQTNEKGDPIEIFFGANNVKLSHEGGIFGDAHLVLLGDVQLPFNAGNWLLELKGGFDYRTGITQDLTYVTIDCSGVKEMGISADIQFSRNLILPVTPNGEALPTTKSVQRIDGTVAQVPNRVTGQLDIIVSDWNDIVAAIDLQPFVLAEQPEKFVFEINEAVFDFSDMRTPDIPFPAHYREKGLLLPSVDNWRGVYIQSLQVALPKTFKTTETIPDNQRVKFGATNMIIDNFGVSGLFSTENLIPLNKGRTNDTNAWAFSVDYLDVELTTNRITSGAFNGEIVLPISTNKKVDGEDKKLGLAYAGLISEEEYHIRVATTDTLDFNVWKAKAQLLPNSFVELNVEDDNFYPRAVLNGKMAISASQKESLETEGETIIDTDNNSNTVAFKGISFQNLVLQTRSPVLQVDYLGYTDEVKLANFPVSIADIALVSNEYGAGLAFDLKINLMGKKDKGFAADARLGIFGKLTEEKYVQHWAYDRLDLSEIYIKADMGAIQLEGGLLLMENDPIFGNGFAADITGTFGSFGPITCKGIFGRKEFRYWYVDAAVHGLALQVGVLQIEGFAGGAFYKMTRRPNAGSDFSPSGLSYIPSADSGLGVKAMVFGGLPNANAIAIGAGFEIEFNDRGGVNRLGLFGEAQVMKAFDFPNPVAKLTDKLNGMVDNEMVSGVLDSKTGKTFLDKAGTEYEPEIIGAAAISAKMGMEFDFVNKSFHATMDLYVNVAGGAIQGRASRGRAGWGVVHISEDSWYVHMGTPTDRLGLKLGVGSVSLQTGGYFMLGDKIPGSPPPPPIVAEILGVQAESLNYMRDENALGEGRGFAFGSDFSIDTGNMNFLMFYARFQAGVGFDIMLKDYGEARCSNTGDNVGINGWYANGQSYAYLQGELGINLKLFFVKKRIPIITAGAAVLLQAKAPNPVWMRGYVGGHYDLLNGLVKGRFNFKMTIGKECEFENSTPLEGIKIISDVTPRDDANEVDVFAAPQVAFNMGVEVPLIIPEEDDDHIYKITLEHFTVSDDKNTAIAGHIEWGQNHNAVTFLPEDILPPTTKLKVVATVGFQEKINGIFKTVMVDGVPARETEERWFTTGLAPEYIPLNNIVYSYPVIDQRYFYPKEHPKGYIQLKQGQDYLFDDAQWKSEIEITDATGNVNSVDFSYSDTSNSLSYNLPKIDNETSYGLVIISRPKNRNTSTEASTSETSTDLADDNSLTILKRDAGQISRDGTMERIGYNFKTSGYSTFAQKIQRIKVVDHNWGRVTSDVIYLFNKINEHEPFATAELVGNEYTGHKPMIVAESDLSDDYFKKDIDPVLYQKYSVGDYKIDRDVEPYGLPPKRALPLFTNYLTNVAHGVNRNWTATHFPFRYNLPEIYKVDYKGIKTKVLNDYVNNKIAGTSPFLSILDTQYQFMRKGSYTIDLQYVLPGGKLGRKASLKYKNPLNFR